MKVASLTYIKKSHKKSQHCSSLKFKTRIEQNSNHSRHQLCLPFTARNLGLALCPSSQTSTCSHQGNKGKASVFVFLAITAGYWWEGGREWSKKKT